jgi:hypothetical protein
MRPQAIMPVPSVVRSATTAGAVRAMGAPFTCRIKTLLRTSPSLPGEIVIESPATKMATFGQSGIVALRSLR